MLCVFDSASQRCDPEPGHVPGSLWEASGTPAAACPALQEAPAPVRTLRRDDLWPAGGTSRGQDGTQHFFLVLMFWFISIFWYLFFKKQVKHTLEEHLPTFGLWLILLWHCPLSLWSPNAFAVRIRTKTLPCMLCPQLLPYVGEELVSVKVEPCSPAVNQERKEVLEVRSCVLFNAS